MIQIFPMLCMMASTHRLDIYNILLPFLKLSFLSRLSFPQKKEKKDQMIF